MHGMQVSPELGTIATRTCQRDPSRPKQSLSTRRWPNAGRTLYIQQQQHRERESGGTGELKFRHCAKFGRFLLPDQPLTAKYQPPTTNHQKTKRPEPGPGPRAKTKTKQKTQTAREPESSPWSPLSWPWPYLVTQGSRAPGQVKMDMTSDQGGRKCHIFAPVGRYNAIAT